MTIFPWWPGWHITYKTGVKNGSSTAPLSWNKGRSQRPPRQKHSQHLSDKHGQPRNDSPSLEWSLSLEVAPLLSHDLWVRLDEVRILCPISMCCGFMNCLSLKRLCLTAFDSWHIYSMIKIKTKSNQMMSKSQTLLYNNGASESSELGSSPLTIKSNH